MSRTTPAVARRGFDWRRTARSGDADTTVKVLAHPPAASEYAMARWWAAHEAAGLPTRALGLTSLLRHRDAVVHVHWPEHMFRHGPLLAVPKALWAVSVLLLVRIQKRTVVWTVHNLRPHGGWRNRWERAFARTFTRSLTGAVTHVPGHEPLVRQIPGFDDEAIITSIPWGSLAPEGVGERRSKERGSPGESRPARFLHLGAVTPYKAQREVLCGLRRYLDLGRIELRIVGGRKDPEYGATIERACIDLKGVEMSDGRVDDDELASHLVWADAAIGVQLEGLNSGVPAACVPAGVPVVLSDTVQARGLQEELGSAWVEIVTRPDDDASWERLIDWARQERGAPPKGAFDPVEAARQHRRFYGELEDRHSGAGRGRS